MGLHLRALPKAGGAVTPAELSEMALAMREAGVLRFEDGPVAVELHPAVFAPAPPAEAAETPDPRPRPPLSEWEAMTPEQQALWASSPEDAEVAAEEQRQGQTI